MKRINMLWVACALAAVVVVGACSSDDGDQESSSTQSASTTAGQSDDGGGETEGPEPPPLVEVESDQGGDDQSGDDASNGSGDDDSEGGGGGGNDDFVAPPTTGAAGDDGDGSSPAQDIIEELIEEDPTQEVGSDVPETPDVVEPLAIDRPCDLFDTTELGELVSQWADQTGLDDDLPSGLLAPGDPVDFAVETDEATNCDWFSDLQIWLVATSWEASDPTFSAIVLDPGTPIDDVGDQAALLSDSQAVAVVEGLLVRVTNLAPGGADSTADGAVTQLLLREVVDRIEAAA